MIYNILEKSQFLLFLKKSGKLTGMRNNKADTKVGAAESVTYLKADTISFSYFFLCSIHTVQNLFNSERAPKKQTTIITSAKFQKVFRTSLTILRIQLDV